MWQKARYVKSFEYPEKIGLTVWVQVEAPFRGSGYSLRDHIRMDGPAYRTNHINPYLPSLTTLVPADNVELLPEFAEDVPLISWDEFLQEAQGGRDGGKP
jgi:hypothetical protein